MSRIRTNLITNRMANGAPTVSNGLVISGVTTSTTFHGDGSNLTGLPAATTINSNVDSQLVTATGTANTLQGESGLTFNGSVLHLNSGSGGLPRIRLQHTGSGNDIFEITSGLSGVSNGGFGIRDIDVGAYRFVIDSSGRIGIGDNSPDRELVVKNASSNSTIKIEASNSHTSQLFFSDTDAENIARIGVFHGSGQSSSNGMVFDLGGTSRLMIASNGKIGINNTNPTHPLHIVNTSSTFNSASLIRGDNSTTGQGAYATFTNTTDSKSAYFGVDGAGLFNLDAGAALVGTNGSESIIFCTNGNTKKVSVSGGTNDRILTLHGGGETSLSSFAPDTTFTSYAGYHQDNHGNQLIGLNASLNYSGTSGTHQWKQNNAHGSIGSAGIFIGGNGSDNNTAITFFRNGQGSSAGTTFAQNSWQFRISDYIQQNFGVRYQTRGYFDTNTNSQNASNAAALAGSLGYSFGYQEAYSTSGGGWAHPYPDLVVGYHTGISMGAYPNYGGIRFFTDHPSSSSTMIMSIGNGNNGVHVVNTLSKGGGSFRIAHPHPSKKYTHDLVHSFIEGPQMDLIYRGKINLVGGSATVNIDTVSNMTDGTFVLLNRDVQCFTSNETGWTAVKGSVSGNILTITAQDNSCTDTVSWMVIGERQDDKIKSLDMTDDDGNLIMEPLTIEETHM